MYKAIFLDLDGTLLDNSKAISDINKNAISRAKELGKKVFICTGRQYSLFENYLNEIKHEDIVICCNGAEIINSISKDELLSLGFDKEILRKLLRYVVDNDLIMRIDTKYARYLNKGEYLFKNEMVISNEEFFKVIEEDNVLQMTVVTTEEKKRVQFLEFFNNNNFGEIIKAKYTYEMILNNEECFFVNLINKNASKGNAINGLCKYLKIDINDVIFCGDDLNDISAIKLAGLGVAMGNASQEVKNEAKFVTDTNEENGIAKVIDKFLIGDENY